MKLLTRDAFREAVFARDESCVCCGQPYQDAHHIVERRLWQDGGYYVDNGASLCGACHIEAEKTTLSCQTIREKAGINQVLLPEHLYSEFEYDKWGNIINPNGTRVKGELFFEDTVQKILRPLIDEGIFLDYVKYPRTYHLPWSPKRSDDDRTLKDCSQFEGKNVVITVKMDGENTSLYKDYFHARSLDGNHHPSQSWVKNFHAGVSFGIPDGWRFCGENLYAKHSIEYKNLLSYFYLFAIYNEKNECLSWNDTILYGEIMGMSIVPVVYHGVWNEDYARNLYQNEINGDKMEGFVVRLADSFPYSQHRKSVAKYVHDSFTIGVHNWRGQAVVPNKLSKK